MELKQGKSTRRPGTSVSDGVGSMSPVAEFSASPLVHAALEHLGRGADRFVARAPMRLDLMGGSACYTGSLALSVPLEPGAFVVVQPRDDGKVSVFVAEGTGRSRCEPLVVDTGMLIAASRGDAAAGSSLTAARARRDEYTVTCLETLLALLAAGVVEDLARGVSIVIATQADGLGDVGELAAVRAALAATVTSALGVALDIDAAMLIGRSVAVDRNRFPICDVDVVSALCGKSGHVIQVRSDPAALSGSVPLPHGMVVIGVDTGAVDEKLADKYWQTRMATEMGRVLIERIIAHDSPEHAGWGGFLSHISVADFVGRFRDRLPTKITGAAYADRFGVPAASSGPLDRSFTYKVRSRTEHHVYEHDRASHFVQYLARAVRNPEDSAAREAAGELMYASHWSYGQRCGLGSIATDSLVGLLRKHGPEAGIYGAKITGKGCGGVVGVLMRDTDQAMQAVASAMEAYRGQEQRPPRLLRSTGAGVMETGVVRM